MATAACCTTPVFPFSALTSSSSSQERTSRSFKLRDDRIFQRSRPYGLIGSWLSCPILRAQCRYISRSKSYGGMAKARASNVDIGAGNYENGSEESSQRNPNSGSNPKASLKSKEHLSGIQYPLSIAGVFIVCLAVFSAIIFMKEDPSAIASRFAKSGFTAAFALIFISEIGDKTFFIAALLAMQYDKAMVLCGSVGALLLMTILSVVIGRIFQSVPAQFQTKMLKIQQGIEVKVLLEKILDRQNTAQRLWMNFCRGGCLGARFCLCELPFLLWRLTVGI